MIMNKQLLRAIAVSFLMLATFLCREPWEQTAGQFAIQQWPNDLRKDLSGSAIKIALPENALDRPWDDALIAKFQELTGIKVQIIRPGNDTTAVLTGYLGGFANGSADADVYAIDIVWPGILADYAEDLRPAFASLPGVLPTLVQNDTVNGRLIAVPYFTEVSLLYYRRDLLQKYRFTRPADTWTELEEQARTIQDGERAHGNSAFWGFLWQGAASEALTCNALEWQISQEGGQLLGEDGTPSVRPDSFVAVLERARRWIGTISPPDVTSQLEDDSLETWKLGHAAFMRNWPYAYLESMKDDSKIKNRIGVTVLPAGDTPDDRHADVLGGFHLMVSKTSRHKSAAIELVKFLTSPEIQRVNATTRGYAPTRPALYYDSAVLRANPFFETLRDVLLKGAVTRPSTVAGAHYDEVSKAYFTAVREALTGQISANSAVQELETELKRLLPRENSRPDVLTSK
jgi:trehalose/maltose transport system substrate-binding protein